MTKYLEFLKEIPKFKMNKTLKIGTDCSGIEAPIQALNYLKINYIHLFSCDNDKHVIDSIIGNYHPIQLFNDITTRDHTLLPQLDIYIAGFPCQAFSMLGKRQGFEDQIRGTIFFDCFETIKYTSPTVFILENVKGLLNHNNTFGIIIQALESLQNYNIYYDLLNTMDYGLPQHRERVYIIGIKKKVDNGFIFPSKIQLKLQVTDLLDRDIDDDDYFWSITDHKMELLFQLLYHQKIDDLSKPWLVNLNVSNYKRTNPMLNICPTLLAGNGGDCIYFLTSHQRRLTPTEYLKLQGFPVNFNQCVSRSKLYKQIGNSMSVNVLCFIFAEIFRSVKF